jgi:hypothetical protein
MEQLSGIPALRPNKTERAAAGLNKPQRRLANPPKPDAKTPIQVSIRDEQPPKYSGVAPSSESVRPATHLGHVAE